MSDVVMGQTVNTVTCPVCRYMSRSFDPFNILSLPIPATAEVVFQCTVYRRASAENCPGALNRSKKGDNPKATRYNLGRSKSSAPPSTSLVAEQYVVSMSRLADCGDLKLKIQNLSGISAKSISKVCRVDETVVNEKVSEKSVLRQYVKYHAVTEKDGPAGLHAKKRINTDEPNPLDPIQIVAFESTFSNRSMDTSEVDAQDDEVNTDAKQVFINRVKKHLSIYGDEKESRLFDSDPVGLAQAVSRSLWPRNNEGFRFGQRVDAKDKNGSWYTGSIVKLYEEEDDEADEGRVLRVHFDNYDARWDEEYSAKQIEHGCILPLYTKTKPRSRQTEFTVFHRYRHSSGSIFFGLPFFLQCKNEWSHARAAAHLLAQTSRFLASSTGKESSKLTEEVLTNISDFIDLLIDYDREYIRMALGMSRHNSAEERSRPCDNPGFDSAPLISEFKKKVTKFQKMLPFEILASQGAHTNDKRHDEIPFPYWLHSSIGNFVGSMDAAGHSLILQWKDVERRSSDSASSTNSRNELLYVSPKVHTHESSSEVLKAFRAKQKKENVSKLAADSQLNLGDCLQEYCKEQKLPLSDMWKCPKCKANREGRQSLALWRLPDLLTFHIKRFNMSARWHERIGTKVDFPMTGLNVDQWCHMDSPSEDCLYDLVGVINHYGSMTGGHYVATCKATASTKDGHEDVAYSFNGAGVHSFLGQNGENPSGWLQRGKPKSNHSRVESASKLVSDSSEPLWLQFDDEVVEPISPQNVVSETAYVLFYRRRNLTPSNVAKYCSLG